MPDMSDSGSSGALFEDCIQPFLIHNSHVKGKMIRLGQVVNTILSRHDYPDIISHLLAEQIVLAGLLSTRLKNEGLLTMQIKGDGLVKFIVVDAVCGGEVRGYAELAEDAHPILEKLSQNGQPVTLPDLLGKGYLAITLQKGKKRTPYQGIVELSGNTLSEAVEEYFTHSEQTEMKVTVSVGKHKHEGGDISRWYAGGILLQHIPFEGGSRVEGSNQVHFDDGEDPQEHWQRATMFTDTVKDEELLNPTLDPKELLYRLFNEDGVWVYDPKPVSVGCRCSRDKIENILKSLSEEELNDMVVDGVISVNCQFCNKEEVFSAGEV